MADTGGGTNASATHQFYGEDEARPQVQRPISQGIGQSSLESGIDTLSHLKSYASNAVTDYGFRAWSSRSKISKPQRSPKDLMGLGDSDTQQAKSSESDMAMNQNQLLVETRTLKRVLKNAMRPAYPNDAQTYLPLGQIESICRREVVLCKLMDTFREDPSVVEPYANYVCGGQDDSGPNENTARKIFAILVLIGRLDKISDFEQARITDGDLPLRKHVQEAAGENFTLVKRSILGKTESVPMSFFDGWERLEKQDFYSKQWRFLSPYFDKATDGSVSLYELDEQSIMPWERTGPEKQGGFVPTENVGGYGKVTQITIHPDHHNFPATTFALKTLFEDNHVPFTNEWGNLKKVGTRDHLLPVYAAYRRGLNYSFIFPWADGGSLHDLWEREPLVLKEKVRADTETTDPHRTSGAQQNRKVITWVAGQLAGITGKFGLGFLHDTQFLESQPTLAVLEGEKRYGIHGDIKPHNILYFEQDQDKDNSGLGLFKISDFGLTGFHSALSRSKQPPTGPHSPTYRSPEYGISEAYLSRKYDIWSLGCVMLQFLVWLIRGSQVLRKFDEARVQEENGDPIFREDHFFKSIPGGENETASPVIKDSVKSHIEALQQIVEQGNYLYDCLELIKTRMLQPNVGDRASCREIHESLASLYDRCLQNSKYAETNLPSFDEPKTSTLPNPIPLISITGVSFNGRHEGEIVTDRGDRDRSLRADILPQPNISNTQQRQQGKAQKFLSFLGLTCIFPRPRRGATFTI